MIQSPVSMFAFLRFDNNGLYNDNGKRVLTQDQLIISSMYAELHKKLESCLTFPKMK